MDWIEKQCKRKKEERRIRRLQNAKYSSIVCKICNEPQYNHIGLSKHLLYTHNIKTKDYYDSYCKYENEGKCIICGNLTKYHNLVNGYKKCCSRSCAAKNMRRNIRNDKEKFNEFKRKVSSHRKKWWSGLSEIDKECHIKKAKSKQRVVLDNMTKEERREKFGWMNRLSKKERDDFLEQHLTNTLIKFWKNASKEERELVYEKRKQTNCINNGYILDYEVITNYYTYRNIVNGLTNSNYRKYKNYINPLNKKRSPKGYHLDHIYSVYDGFLNDIDPKIISSPANLRIITASENVKKRNKSTITKNRMFGLYEKKEWLSSGDI